MFFSIVIRLSAFGRLILHTGAMAQRPVLSEELEKELLPTGLFASLVIRAHHRRRKNTSVTNQYRRQTTQQQQAQGGQTNAARERIEEEVYEAQHHPRENGIDSRGRGRHRSTNSDGTMFASDDEGEVGSLVYTEAGNTTTMGSLSAFAPADPAVVDNMESSDNTPGRSFQSTHRGPASVQSSSKEVLSKTTNNAAPLAKKQQYRHHQRTQTGDTTLFLPPAAILNMSLSGKEFKELIDNVIDTSSMGVDDNKLEPEASVEGNDRPKRTKMKNKPPQSPPFHSLKLQSESGMPPPYPVPPSSANNNNHHTNTTTHMGTRHHRRVSSSRFLLHEWAQESNVRDLYGAAPPADLPREITLLAEEHGQQYGDPMEEQAVSSSPLLLSSSSRWSPRRMWSHRSHNNQGFMSSFSLDETSDHDQPPEVSHGHGVEKSTIRAGNTTSQQLHTLEPLTQPLLPDLHDNLSHKHDDEELGGALLGEEFLPAEGRRRRTLPTSNRKIRPRKPP